MKLPRTEMEDLVLDQVSEIVRRVAPHHDDRHSAELLDTIDYLQHVVSMVAAYSGGGEFAWQIARRSASRFAEPEIASEYCHPGDDWINAPVAGHA